MLVAGGKHAYAGKEISVVEYKSGQFVGQRKKVKQIKDTKDEQSTKQCFLILNRRKIQVWLLYKHNMAGT